MGADRRVAVTGIGLVGPGMVGSSALRERLLAGETAIGPIRRFDTSDFSSHNGAFVEDFDPKPFIPAAKMRRMNQLSRLTVASAKLAFDDRGEGRAVAGIERGGVAIGTMFGPVETSVKYLDEYREKGSALAPPQLFAESVANAPGSHVAIQYGLKGFNLTFTQREASAMTALVTAALQVAKGAAPMALAGGVDEINDITYGVYDRISALARAVDGGGELARPFDRRRNGLSLGEGGAIFILTSDPQEEPLYGWVAGFAQGRDRTAGLSDWGGDDAALDRVMRRAIADAGIEPEQIGAIYASANGNVKCDALEARALLRLFGESCPPVVATKGLFGEYAAGGGLQIAAALLGLRHGELYPSVGFEQAQEGSELPVTTRTEALRGDYVLVNALSAGGGLLSIVLSSREVA